MKFQTLENFSTKQKKKALWQFTYSFFESFKEFVKKHFLFPKVFYGIVVVLILCAQSSGKRPYVCLLHFQISQLKLF